MNDMNDVNDMNEAKEMGAPGTADDDAALRAEIDAELAAERAAKVRAGHALTGLVLLIGGVIGWISALKLQHGKETLLANPDAILSCDVNPFISCGNVMMTWQSSALGIPNMAIGLGGFAIMAAIGALMISGPALPSWFRWARLGGMTFAFGYVHFLALSSIFLIRALCPWCLVIWTVTAPMFFSTLAHTIESGQLKVPAPLANLLRRWVVLTLAWYLLVIVVILAVFWRQWLVVFGIA